MNRKFRFKMIFIFLICIVTLIGCNVKLNIEKSDDNINVIKKDSDEGIENKKDSVLSLGTVVSLKNSDEKLMISGWMQIPMNEEDKIYDYVGYIYPIGFISVEHRKLFNEEDIEKIYFYGYEDEDGIGYRNKVIEYRNNLRNRSDELLKEDNTDNLDYSEYIVNKDKMLRLGTIVSVKGKEHRYMIISRLIRNNDNELFDYYGCLYPEGNLTDDDKILFNDDEINNIYFNGYENEQEVERNKELVKYKSIIEKNQ